MAFSPKWVFPLVCVPKKNEDVLLCADTCKTNTVIIWNYCPIPTLDEILYEINGAKIFSKIDLAQSFHYTDRTTFSTPQGLFWYKRLIIGAKDVFKDFQKIVETNTTHDINDVFNVSDDYIAYTTNQNNYLQQLRKVFDKIREKGLNLT